jgi:hypothetical protein
MRLLLAFLASTCLWAQLPQAVLRIADPNAQALFGVEWSRIANSQYINEMRSKFGGELKDVKGLEFLENLDRVMLSVTPGARGGKASVLIVVEGRFNVADVRKLIIEQKATPQRFRGIEIFKAPQGKGADEMDLAILSGQTILAGDRPSLLAAIERAQVAVRDAAPNSIHRRAATLAAKSDVWGVASPEIISAMGLKEIGGQLQLAAGNDPFAQQILKVLSNVENGGPIEFGFNLDEMQKNAPRLALRPKVTISPAPPAQQAKIRIYGLDEGVKEVDFKD